MVYDGHAPGPWRVTRIPGALRRRRIASAAFTLEGEIGACDAKLVADAPLLLAQRDALARRAAALAEALERLVREADRDEGALDAVTRDALDEARAVLHDVDG